ncbi:efflux transporter outer membrane subunit [Bradyrhizobium erythrophlei]|uniref:Efflux transporter, outer membrane factor (OMF) lipoprotein, NodT family n=1 Tax=Bradyrhizobium erythrophlei TaxID=1437360 RepID=A0A1M5HGE9_9BRAD|nr:efflux transporter, outer membrane factor (OMF) lipoprotein, NodT family [Bradyrhizobium erythrophlei]
MRALRLMACLSVPMLGIGLAGCTVGPNFESPEIAEAPRRTSPEAANVPSRAVVGEIDQAWWKSFRDPQLSSLVERLVVQNLDLKTAAERVVQSVAQRQVAVSQGLPHIEGQSLSTYNRVSPNGPISEFVPAPGSSVNYALFQDGLTSSWQLDLFGRVRRAVEAADANALAAVENRHGVALAAVAELAQSYMQLRGTQNRLDIAKRNLGLAEQSLDLVKARFGNGVATTLELAQARAQQATIAATLPPLRTQEAELINAVGLLLGEAPRALESELRRPRALPRMPRRIPLGLPGTLIRRRPDVREAEAQLHEATAETGVAVANFYPDVTLNGAASVQSLHLSNLFSLGSTAFSVGPDISIPIFEGGRLRGALALRESRQRETAIVFQRTVLRAWQEVDDALTAYSEAQRRRADLARAVTENQAALQAAQQRYSEGAIDFLNVNTTQAQLLQSENDLADIDTRIATDLVNLYRALGEGWEDADVAVRADRAPRRRIGTP